MGEIGYISEINLKKTPRDNRNKSIFFVLPFLGQPSYWYYELINCYLGDTKNKPDFTFNKIFLNLRNYDKKVLSASYFNQFYQLEDNTYMYVFDIPREFEEDYNKFCNGKYSEISEKAKALICRCSGVKPIINSVVYKVLYKTADQKKKIEDLIGEELPLSAEVCSKPDLEKEVYSLLTIKNSKLQIEKEDSEREKV